MIVIVTGGRYYNNKAKVYEELDKLNPTLIVQGGASGADALAKQYAIEKNIAVNTEKADWEKYGKAAGPLRNELMCMKNRNATLLAFPGGAGTASCIRYGKEWCKQVIEVDDD